MIQRAKVCCHCKAKKAAAEFSLRKQTKDGLAGRCKPCMKLYHNNLYHGSSLRRKQVADARRSARSRARRALLEYLAGHPCIDCGESDPIVLEFDHRDAKDKKYSISVLVAGGRAGVESLLLEIAKCDVRCANCHRRRTARQFGWTKLLGI